MGTITSILQELQTHELDFRNYMRMSVSTFYILLAKVEPYIKKQDTHMRHSITAEARLEATLRYLATTVGVRTRHCRTVHASLNIACRS